MVNCRGDLVLSLHGAFLPRSGSPPVGWAISDAPVDYGSAVAVMEERAAAIAEGRADELVWLVEHPPLYTAGTSARESELIDPSRFPVHRTGRGGRYTYHGPGQRVAYVMLDLKRRRPDMRRYVAALEAWLIATLDAFNILGERRENRVGVWVRRPEKGRGATGEVAEDKIAAIGVRVRRWVTFHGVSLNVEPDLAHFSGIVPCGVRGRGVTSLVDLGLPVTMPEVDEVLREKFARVFGVTEDACLDPSPSGEGGSRNEPGGVYLSSERDPTRLDRFVINPPSPEGEGSWSRCPSTARTP